jgi:predicted  nucleic acid-binding Zn-ribbon protein
MGDAIIKVKNSSYARYEELLLRRDAVKKSAFQYGQEYTRTFGELILKVFEKKIECIRKKKTVEYCQSFKNHGKNVDLAGLQTYLGRQLAEYEERLKAMIEENEAAKSKGTVTEGEMLQIKRIYRRMVKKIHPDINPLTNTNEDLKGLWHRLVIAYDCNDLKEMKETEVLINALLAKLDIGVMEIEIPDIEVKIKELEEEVDKIMNTDPYQYRYLLEDKTAVEEKKKALEDELKEYEEYSNKLEEMLNSLLGYGMTFTFMMN